MTKDDFTSGPYPDDGWGYSFGDGSRCPCRVGGQLQPSARLAADRWRGQAAGRSTCCWDRAAAHTVAVLLARMAYITRMDTRWQQVRSDYLRSGRLLIDGNWERTGVLVPFCQARRGFRRHR